MQDMVLPIRLKTMWTWYNQSQNANVEDQASWVSWYAPDEFGGN